MNNFPLFCFTWFGSPNIHAFVYQGGVHADDFDTLSQVFALASQPKG
jgi:hypothetical protein